MTAAEVIVVVVVVVLSWYTSCYQWWSGEIKGSS